MRIGIDARLISQTGVGRYIRNLIWQIEKLDKKNEFFIYLTKKDFKNFSSKNSRLQIRHYDIPWHSLSEQIIGPLIFAKDRLDVVHFPYFNVPIFYTGKYLLTIHDLIVDHFETGRASTRSPFVYQIKRLGYKIANTVGVNRASQITVISKTTAGELFKHYKVDPKRVSVTYDGLDLNFLKILKTQKRVNFYNTAYILYVGNAYPHKNLEKLITAFSIVLKNRKIKLVLAGDDNYFFPRLKDNVKELDLHRDIIFFGQASDSELVNLYTHAKCVVFPSLMEGFGLPNLESLACGCLPVIADIPVFHEIWGDLLDYFNPLNVEDMASKIIKTISLPISEYKDKVNYAKERIKDFSWETTAATTLKLYEQISKF